MADAPKRLFTPTRFGPVELRNRTVRSAAFEGMAPGGLPSDSLVAYHRSVAAGGVGMTTVAYVAVAHDGLTFGHQMWARDEIVPGLRKLTDAVHQGGAAASVQLGHSGHLAPRSLTGKVPMAPSRVFVLAGPAMPRAMTEQDIEALVDAHVRAVGIAREAGFDAVEVHAGHGYLISQFLCPATNRRTDRWGGDLEGRARLARTVVERVREAAGPQMAVVVKTNTRDGFPGGTDLDESVEVARMLEKAGADALVLSGGFVSHSPMYLMRGEVPMKDLVRGQPSLFKKVGVVFGGPLILKRHEFTEAYFLEDALRFREAVSIPLVLVGGLRTLATMEAVLEKGIDAVALARPLIMEPDLVLRMERGEADGSRCIPCNRCMGLMYYGEASCPELDKTGPSAPAHAPGSPPPAATASRSSASSRSKPPDRIG